jgi:hypothetical protein
MVAAYEAQAGDHELARTSSAMRVQAPGEGIVKALVVERRRKLDAIAAQA